MPPIACQFEQMRGMSRIVRSPEDVRELDLNKLRTSKDGDPPESEGYLLAGRSLPYAS